MTLSRFTRPAIALGALCLLATSLPAQEIEEIVVTARKRTESVQDIPLSISVFDEEAIAAAGIRYERAYSASPLCVPARTALLTGMGAARTGVADNLHALRPDYCEAGIRTWPELLARAGYTEGCCHGGCRRLAVRRCQAVGLAPLEELHSEAEVTLLHRNTLSRPWRASAGESS